MLRDHFVAYFSEGEEANIVFSEEAALAEIMSGAVLVAKVTPNDGIWREWIDELAQIHFHSAGPQGIWPEVLKEHLDRDQLSAVNLWQEGPS